MSDDRQLDWLVATEKKNIETYVQNQARWVVDNNVEVGTIVKIMRSARSGEGGWDNDWWLGEMDDTVGDEGKVTAIYSRSGIELEDEWCYPFFILEVVR